MANRQRCLCQEPAGPANRGCPRFMARAGRSGEEVDGPRGRAEPLGWPPTPCPGFGRVGRTVALGSSPGPSRETQRAGLRRMAFLLAACEVSSREGLGEELGPSRSACGSRRPPGPGRGRGGRAPMPPSRTQCGIGDVAALPRRAWGELALLPLGDGNLQTGLGRISFWFFFGLFY